MTERALPRAAGLREHPLAVATPTTWPPGATRRASARASSPVPQPRSRIRWPTRGWSRASIRRLHARTEAISLAASTKRTKNLGSTAVSTCVNRSTVAGDVMQSPTPRAPTPIRFPELFGCGSGSRSPDADGAGSHPAVMYGRGCAVKTEEAPPPKRLFGPETR